MTLLDQAVDGASVPAGVRKSWFFYGVPGAGKTTAAIAHPGKRKLLIDVDYKFFEMNEKVPGLRVWQPNVPLGSKNIQTVIIDPTRKNTSAGNKIVERPRGYELVQSLVNELNNGDCPFDCVILDSVSSLVDHLEYLILYNHNVTIITETLYSVLKQQLKEFFNSFMLLPCDRIVIAHEKEVTNDEGGVIGYKPNITGTYAKDIMKVFTEAYRFLGRGSSGAFSMQTSPTRMAPARTATAAFREKSEHVIDTKTIFQGR